MSDYLGKPVQLQELAEKLDQWLPAEEDCQRPQSKASAPTPLEPAAEQQSPVYDRDGFLDRLMGDEEMAQTVVEVFLDDIPKRIESLKRSLEAGDAETVKRIAHSIEGAAANIGGEALRELAGEIEKACEDGHFESVNERCPELEHQFNRLKEAIQKPTLKTGNCP